jgi:hypothetical protein
LYKWETIARLIPGRTARQCRERWQLYLCPSVNRGPWTPEEDRLLLDKYLELGPRWTVLCQFFENRSFNNVKNRWNSVIRKMQVVRLTMVFEQDFLYCAGLVTYSAARLKRQITEESRRYQADPLEMFKIANLLNRPPPPRLCTSVAFGH